MTLTGLRGLMMPVLGVAIYQTLEAISPGLGPWVVLVPLALNIGACVGFVKLSRAMRAAG
jgi:hypothetical protein